MKHLMPWIILGAILIVTALVISLLSWNENRKRIKQAAAAARALDAAAKKEAKRLAAQERIGDEILMAFINAWHLAGSPIERAPQVMKDNGGKYYIQISRDGSGDPISVKMWLFIDLRNIGKEFSFTDAGGRWTDDTEMSVVGGRDFIQRNLIHRIWPEIRTVRT